MASGSASPKLQQIGGEVQDFTLPELDGPLRSLSAELAACMSAVFVFWSCICSHLIRYDDYLNACAARHPAIALIAIASRRQETPAELARAVQQRNLNFPIL